MLGILLVVVTNFCPVACRGVQLQVENHSFARPTEVVMTHLELDLTVNFAEEQLHGRATIHLNNKTGAREVYLDSRALAVERVTLGAEEEEGAFEIGEDAGYLGRPLIVQIKPDTKVVNVYYHTTEGATALDWLKPSQTSGGKEPFLYTQGQAILNRSWIPCQDNTAIRITYDARIKTPPGMMAVMSAKNGTQRNPDGVYEFSMPQPIPPYLIALAVGDLEFRAISERCGVYAEADVVDRAQWEFADTESMIQQAEKLYGPYRWGRYDIIVLPPSFPYGGMENPRLSFVTPVLLAGDRSLVATIAHELAHSWSGNLVTNATWSDFWLNEGFTTYFELRILETLYGRERMELQAALGYRELQANLERFGRDDPDTRLRPNVSDRDPDEGLNTIPYEKGYLFLRHIEETVGRERWDEFLRNYFDRFAFQTMTSSRFVEYLRSELVRGDDRLEEALAIDEWVYEPGLPENHPEIQSKSLERVNATVESWKSGTPAGELDTSRWSSQEWKLFLQGLPAEISAERMKELDEVFDLTDRSNGEILQVWLLHAIANAYEPAYPRLESFLIGLGRIWLIRPLYQRLADTPEGLIRAKEIYSKARAGYHPVTINVIDRVLEPREEH